MTGDGVLPGVKHICIALFLVGDAALVLELCQFGGSLLVHLLLKVAAHGTITLSHLSQDIGLVSLARKSIIHGLVLECSVLAIHIIINLILLIILQPFSLLLQLLLQEHILLPIGIHILHQVDLGLVFSSPLLLSSLPNLIALLRYKIFNHLFICLLVRCLLLVIRLKFLDLTTSCQSLIFFKLLQCLLFIESCAKELLVTNSLFIISLFSQLFLSCIMGNELKVTLTVQEESLSSVFLLFFLLDGPLLFKHSLLFLHQFTLLGSLKLSCVLLPIKYSHCLLDFVLLIFCLLHLSFEFLLSIQGPELGIDLFFNHFVFNVSAFVDELLFALNGGSVIVELSILLSQVIICHLELHISPALNFSLSLSFSLILELSESVEHLLSDLLWGLHVVVKLLLVDAILGLKECSESGFAGLQIRGLSSLHVSNTALDDVLLDHLLSLSLPESLVMHIMKSFKIIKLSLQFLYKIKQSRVNMTVSKSKACSLHLRIPALFVP